MFKKMDNRAFQRDAEAGVELKEKYGLSDGTNGMPQPDPLIQPSTSCKPEVCQAARRRFAPPELGAGPWHRKKTIFLVTFLVALGVWLIIYVTLSELKLL